MNTDDPRNPHDPLDAIFHAARGEDAPYIEAAGGFGRIEFGFETRMLARIREERGSSWLAWAARLCPFAAALAVAAGVWGYMHREDSPDGESVVDAVRLAGMPVLDYYLGGDQ
ncbi:MAG: hypothetical protein ABI318_19800 [Chthoniobacteraceae bacterium]